MCLPEQPENNVEYASGYVIVFRWRCIKAYRMSDKRSTYGIEEYEQQINSVCMTVQSI